MASKYATRVHDGMDVYDVNEEKIGTVHEVYDAVAADSNSGGYLRVPTGFLGMGTEHHIPFSAIQDVRDERIQLSVPKDRLDELGYDEAPADVEGDDFDGDRMERTTTTTTTSEREMPGQHPTPSRSTDAPRTVQLREEELVARKRTVETGQVGIHTDVVSEERTLDVPVTREEVTIERHRVDPRPSDRPIGDSETISVPVHEDQVTLDKKAAVYEEVDLGTRTVQETQRVSGTVRREEAVVDKDGDVNVTDGDTRSAPIKP